MKDAAKNACHIKDAAKDAAKIRVWVVQAACETNHVCGSRGRE